METPTSDIELLIAGFLLLLVYGIPLTLIGGGLIIGTILERRHFHSIRERESHYAHYPTTTMAVWDAERTVAEVELVTASVVVSLDYFKRFLAKLRTIFGGRVRVYESLLDRARREAILRLKEGAPQHDIIINLRLDTSVIASGGGRRNAKTGGIEVLASGTAVRYAPAAAAIAE